MHVKESLHQHVSTHVHTSSEALFTCLQGQAGLSSPSAAVRLHAIQLLQALFVSDPGLHAGPATGTATSVPPEQAAGSVSLWAASRYLLLELAAKEADPAVLRSAVCVGGQLLARCASDCSARELEQVLLMLALLGGSMDFQVSSLYLSRIWRQTFCSCYNMLWAWHL